MAELKKKNILALTRFKKLYSFQNFSLGFILGKFQARYFYKITVLRETFLRICKCSSEFENSSHHWKTYDSKTSKILFLQGH